MPEPNSEYPADDPSSNDDEIPLSSDVPSSGPGSSRGLWTAQREELHGALSSQSTTCAQLYREAVNALGSPDLGIGKLVVAGHAVRELVNLLPVVLADVDLPERVRDSDLRDDLVAAWGGYQADVAAGIAATGLVPSSVSNALDAFVKAQGQITENARARRAALVLGTTEAADDSSVSVVVRAIGVFERFRHPGPDDAMPASDRRLYQHALSIVENAITSRILGFFSVKRMLQDVIDGANVQAHDGTWTPPDDDEVSTTLSQIGGLQHRRVFYDQLANPEWIRPLDRFSALRPPNALDPESEQFWQPWPAGDYLVRMAPHKPGEVREILLRVIDELSTWSAKVRLLEAALRMPAEDSRGLAHAIERHLSVELDPHLALDLVTFIERLVQIGSVRPAKRLADALLRPRPSPNGGGMGRRDVRAGIDSYWYPQALQRVVTALADDSRVLGTVYAWLREEQIISDSWDPERDWDASSIWRPSIGDHEQNYGRHDIADALVEVLRDLAIQQMERGDDLGGVMATLERDRMPIAMRVALFALSSQVAERSDALQVATERVLDREQLDHPWFFREYTQMAATTLPMLTDRDFARWEALVDAGPQLSETRRQRILEHLEEGQTAEEALAQYATYRRHELLSAVGSDALRGRLLELHTTLVGELGEYEHAGFRSWSSFSTGEKAPTIAVELSEMSPQQVLETLRTWEPEKGERGTKEGLAESLREAVEARPSEFSPMTHSFVELNDPYRARFLDGIRKSAESSTEIDWRAFLLGVAGLQNAVRAADQQSYSLRQVCNCIENAVQGQTSRIPEGLFTDAVVLVATYLDDPDPADDEGSGGDHLTRALNTMRPVAVRTLVRLARAAKLAESAEFDSSVVIAAVRDALRGRLVPRDRSLAVAAAFGESLSLMMWIDSAWVHSWLPGAVTADPLGDVLVTTALTTNSTSTELLDDLWPQIDAILDREAEGDDIEMGWRSARTIVEVIGDHLMTLGMWGSGAPWPERTTSYFNRVSSESAASVLGQVGWRLMNTSEPSPELIERASSIWDERQDAVDEGRADAEQLAQFYWWVHSDKFPVSWWLPRLTRVADQIDFDGRSFIGEHIEEAAHAHPGAAVALLTRLLRSDETKTLGRHGLITSAPKVIALGLRTRSNDVVQASQALMDVLGEQGVVDMDLQVTKASHELDAAG